MFGVLRRSARLVLTAGAVSFVPVALASSPYAPLPSPWSTPPAAQAPVAVPAPAATAVAPAQTGLEAMKVELAWVADPTTYHLDLEVHARGDSLEVRGQVPDNASRLCALKVARQACYLPVHDALRVVDGVGAPKGGKATLSDEEIAQTVGATLKKHLGPRAVGMGVTVQKGKVALQGQIDSMERKVIASHCLRGLAGASCVINGLRVTTASSVDLPPTPVTPTAENPDPVPPGVTRTGGDDRDGVPLPPLPSRDEQTSKPAEAPAAKEAKPAGPKIRHVTAMPYTLPPSPTPTLPSGLPPSRFVYIRMHPTKNGPAGTVTEVPAVNASYAAPPSGYATPTPSAPPAPVALADQAACCAPDHQDKRRCKPRFIERLLPFCFLKRDTCPAQPVAVSSTPTPAQPAVSPAMPSPAPAPQAAPSVRVAPTRVSRPLADSGAWRNRTHPQPVNQPAPRTEPERPAAATPVAASEPVVPTAARQPRSPSPVAEKPEPTKLVPTPHPPVVADRGGNEPVPVVPEGVVSQGVTPAQLCEAIRKACGNLVKEVRVENTPKGPFLHVEAVPGAEQELANKMLTVPEFLAASVKMELNLGK